MQRIRALTPYQKIVLLILLMMALLFTILYPVTISREGFLYKDAILLPEATETGMIYSGRIDGESASFTVSEGKVTFQHGDKFYGPYTVREDETAIPQDSQLGSDAVGLEVYCEDDLLFRGAALDQGGLLWLYNEDGSIENFGVTAILSSGVMIDGSGEPVDPLEPSVSTVLNLLSGPALTHKGDWTGWFCGMLLCIGTAVSILFVDELFYLSLSFQIRDPDRAEPSEWEIFGRYASWTIIPLLALLVFVIGLNSIA